MIRSAIPHDLHSYFDRVYWPRQLGGKAQTQKLYRLTLDRLGEFIGQPATLDDLNDDTLCAFLQTRLATRAAHTVDKEKDKLVALSNFAARKRHIEEFVELPAIPLPDKQPQAMSMDQIGMLLQACRETSGFIGKAKACDWWYAYHVVGLITGERTGAMHSLRWEWLRPDGWLPVPGSARKTKKAETHWLTPHAMEAVEKLRGLTIGRIFDAPFVMCTFWNRNKKLLGRAGLPTTREWQPQMNRRTFASWLEANGGNATEALQHTDRRTTKESYLDPTIATKAPASRIVGPVMGLS